MKSSRLYVIITAFVSITNVAPAFAQLSPEETRRIQDAVPTLATAQPRQEKTLLPSDPMSFFNHDSLKTLLRYVSSYQYGDSRAHLTDLDEFIRGVHDLPEGRKALETHFLEFLKGNPSHAGKQFVVSRLALIGSDASVAPLVSMLADTASADMALYALEMLPGERVDGALREAMTHSNGRVLVGLINALGNRRVKQAARDISPHVSSPDTSMSEAAISALGKIGTAEAVELLRQEREKASGTRRGSICEALLNCADQQRVQGETDRALAVYKMLTSPVDPVPARRAALRGTVLADPKNATALLKQVLSSSDATLHPMAMQLIGEIPTIDEVRTIAGILPQLPAASQTQLLAALARFRDVEVQRIVVSATGSKDPQIRTSALRALGSMGNSTVAPLLAKVAATTHGTEQIEARRSLYALRGSGVDDSLIAMLSRADKALKVELLRGIGERKVVSAVPRLLQLAKDPATPVRIESARALKEVASSTDLPHLVDLLVHARDQTERRELEVAVVSVARSIADRSKQDEAVLAVYPTVLDVPNRMSLLNVLGKIGAPASLPVLQAALQDKSPDVRATAIRALSEWPTAEPYPDLWRCATEAKDPSHRILALRGAVRLIGIDSSRSADQTVDLYRKAMAVAPNNAERKYLLSAIGDVRSVSALQLVAEYLKDSKLHQEAEAATLAIAGDLTGSSAREAVPHLKQLVSSSPDSVNVARAKRLIKRIESNE